MTQETAEAVAEAIAAIGAGEAMPAEGGDRKYIVDGRAWRVRLKLIDQRTPVAPVNGKPELAPVGFGVGVSVALLDEDDAVATDETGALLVFDQHTVSMDAEALGRPKYAPVAALNYAIAGEIAAAASILSKRAQLVAALAPWASPSPGREGADR